MALDVRTAVSFALAITVSTVIAQQPAPPGLLDQSQVIRTAAATVRVSAIKGFVYPWALAILPNGDMLVSEQNRNTLRLIHQGALDPTPITGIPPVITSKRRDTAGVEVIAHPKFAENHIIYIACWKPKPGDVPQGADNSVIRTAVLLRARYENSPALKDVTPIFEATSETDGPSAARLAFGRDGKIYMAIGAPGFTERAGRAADAQDPNSYLGKILRLNEDGTVPSDNPFVNRKGYRPQIFALGIRNAIGLTLHPETGELWETENGPQGGDEVNIIRAGQNYGWPVVTYGRAYTSDPDGKKSGLPPPTVQPPTFMTGMVEPVTYYKPSIAIAGVIFYTGDKFPLWKGNLIAGALVGTQLTRIQFNRQGLETRREAMLTELHQRIRDVRQGPDGLIYLTTDMPDGAVLKLEPVAETLAAAPMAGEPPARAVAYDNVHIRVLDPAKAAEWYVRAFGAKASEPPAAGTAQVVFGSNVITIVKGDTAQSSAGTVIDHIGLSFRDLDAAVKQAEAAGAKVTSAPRESPGIFRYAYVEDPWGVRIEMVEDSERLGFHHVHLRVKDPDATLGWYQRQFGGTRTKLRGRLDGVRFDGVWLFAMSSGADLPAPAAAIQLVAFRVDDVDAGMRALTAAGVKASAEPRTLPALRYALVEDPNGIRVELVKRTKTP